MIKRVSQQTIHDVDNHINIENKFDIPIEKVEDYNDFVTQLRNDKKFERMIQDMTIGRINGKNSFTKYKYNWKDWEGLQ